MDEDSFDIDIASAKAAVRRFPSHILTRASALAENVDLGVIKDAADQVTDKVKRLWDEGGHDVSH